MDILDFDTDRRFDFHLQQIVSFKCFKDDCFASFWFFDDRFPIRFRELDVVRIVDVAELSRLVFIRIRRVVTCKRQRIRKLSHLVIDVLDVDHRPAVDLLVGLCNQLFRFRLFTRNRQTVRDLLLDSLIDEVIDRCRCTDRRQCHGSNDRDRRQHDSVRFDS